MGSVATEQRPGHPNVLRHAGLVILLVLVGGLAVSFLLSLHLTRSHVEATLLENVVEAHLDPDTYETRPRYRQWAVRAGPGNKDLAPWEPATRGIAEWMRSSGS
jgi:hypothetical protein